MRPGQEPQMAQMTPMLSAFFGKWSTAALSTVDEKGEPHACNVFVAARWTDQSRQLFWVSGPGTAHSQHVAASGRVAVAMYAHVKLPARLHGLQMHGEARAIARDEPLWERAWETYGERYPFVKVSPLRERVMSEGFYGFEPTWVRWIDNRVRFGFKQEWTFTPRR